MTLVLLSVGGVKHFLKRKRFFKGKGFRSAVRAQGNADSENYSIVFLVCIFCAAFFFFFGEEAKWANLCGFDLLKGQEATETSKERLPRNRSGNTKCR